MNIEEITAEADPSDQATLREAQFLEAAIEDARVLTGPKATGRCLYCGEALASEKIIKSIREGKHDGQGVKRWCPADDPEHGCRVDWEHQQRRARINGRFR